MPIIFQWLSANVYGGWKSVQTVYTYMTSGGSLQVNERRSVDYAETFLFFLLFLNCSPSVKRNVKYVILGF